MEEVTQGGRDDFVLKDVIREGLRQTTGFATTKSLDKGNLPREEVRKVLLQ